MLPAFIELLAATGARPGEVLAIRWADVDLLGSPPTVTVNGTVVDAGRVAGKPLHRQEGRKGGAPPHTVSLPAFGVQVLADLYAATGPDGPVLTNRDGGLVALTNIRSSLREALANYEHLHWVTPHSFRRTVATVVRDGLGVEAGPLANVPTAASARARVATRCATPWIHGPTRSAPRIVRARRTRTRKVAWKASSTSRSSRRIRRQTPRTIGP